MKIINSKQMKEIDKTTITEYKIDDSLLMENAGILSSLEIGKKYPPPQKVAIFIGSGNNGGDGLVIARHLFLKNYDVTIFYIGNSQKSTPNNKKNLLRCKKLNIPIKKINENTNLLNLAHELKSYEIIIDAMLGIGLNKPLEGFYLEIINLLNSINIPAKIAIDIPTGISGNTGEIKTNAFKSHLTITFGLPEIGHILSPARFFCGELIVKNIGFPLELLNDKKFQVNLITKNFVQKTLPERIKYFHKYNFGNVVIFAGSKGKSGAGILASNATLKSGAGIVTSIVPEEINSIMETNLIEVMTYPINLSSSQKAFEKSKKLFEKSDVILVGCGISTEKNVADFLLKIISLKNKIFVLDDDALNILSNHLSLLNNSENTYILTPHIGEMSRLAKTSKEEILKNPIEVSLKFTKTYNVILVLKSCETIITSPTGEVYINIYGNEGMATAGSGDVLAGIIAGIVAQNIKQKKSIFNSTVSAVYIHSIAGRIAMEKQGSFSLTAMDLIKNLPGAFEYVNSV